MNLPFRNLYNGTLKTYPAAEIVLSAAILIVSSVLNFYMYTQKWKIPAEESITIEDISDLNLDKTAKSEETGQIESYTYL
jgi:hypothetical protein